MTSHQSFHSHTAAWQQVLKKIHITTLPDVRLEVFMVVQYKTWCFWDVMPHHRVKGPHHLRDTIFFSNVRNHLPSDLVSYPRRMEYSDFLLLSTTHEHIQSFPSCSFQIWCPSDILSFKAKSITKDTSIKPRRKLQLCTQVSARDVTILSYVWKVLSITEQFFKLRATSPRSIRRNRIHFS